MMYFSSFPCSHHLILLVFLILICGQNYAATPYAMSPASCYFLSLYPDIVLSTLFSNALSVCLSLKVTDQVSHLYKARGKITLLCIFIFNFY